MAFSKVAWRAEDDEDRAEVVGANAATEGPAKAKRVKENFIVFVMIEREEEVQ